MSVGNEPNGTGQSSTSEDTSEFRHRIPEADVTKLHAESLQLRSQQFFIGTLALTGSGLALGFSTKISTSDPSKGWVMLIILVAWLVVLGFLFYWSLSLKSLISVISEYLKNSTVNGINGVKPVTHWEKWYDSLKDGQGEDKAASKNYLISQTALIKTAFCGYGTISALVNIVSYMTVNSSQCHATSPTPPFWLIGIGLWFLYIVCICCIKEHFDTKEKNLKHQVRNHRLS